MYIYKIHKENDPNCYVGKTVKNFYYLKKQHLDGYFNKQICQSSLLYSHIKASGGWNGWKFTVLECVEDCDRFSLYQLEQKWIDEIKPSLNCNKAPTGLSKEEYGKQYRETHKEQIKKNKDDYMKQYYKQHKELLKQNHKQYRETHKEYNKQYYEQNKEQSIQYYKKNKERLTQKHNCPCGGKYTTTHRARHLKTKRHQTYVKSIIEK